MSRMAKVLVACCSVVLLTASGVAGVWVGVQIEREENRRVEAIGGSLQRLAAEVQRIVPLVEGDWKKFGGQGWEFMPTGGKPWGYWREREDVMFFTLLDLTLHCQVGTGVCPNGTLRPFQYRRPYTFGPSPVGFPSGGIAEAFENDEGRIWIGERSPGRLALHGKAHPVLWRRPVRISVVVFSDELDRLAATSDAFYFKPFGKWRTSLHTVRYE